MPDDNKILPEPETELQREVLQPIAGDSPAGRDARETNDYDNLKAEIDKRGGNDYENVIELSRAILAKESKDLRVASFLCFGLFNPELQYKSALDIAKETLRKISDEQRALGKISTPTAEQRKKLEALPKQVQAAQEQIDKQLAVYKTKYRFDGLAEGLRIIHLLLLQFGENLFPKDENGRINTINWLVNKLAAMPDICIIKPEHRDGLIKTREVAALLDGWLKEKFAVKSPSFKKILDELDKQIKLLPAPKEPPVARQQDQPQPSQPPQSEPQQSPAPSAPPQNKAELPPPTDSGPVKAAAATATFKDLAEAREAISKASAYIINQELTDPLPYRIRRMQLWDASPQVDQTQTTLLPPPSDHAKFREDIKERLKNQEWEYVINRCEWMFSQGTAHFWLDLQRFIDMAAVSRGGEFKKLSEAIRWETVHFLTRAPGIEEFRFSDGTPFADADTQNWIVQMAKPSLGLEANANGQLGGAPASPVAASLAAEFEAAKKMLEAPSGLNKALKHIQAGMRSDASHQNNFRRRLFMAMLCVQMGEFKFALPLLEALDKDIEKHRLQLWDPDLSLAVWIDLKRCYDRLLQLPEHENNQAYRDAAGRTLEKICQIDASQAIAV
jgi:type VI secretion system protein VasJ